jgi:hypothetical protein
VPLVEQVRSSPSQAKEQSDPDDRENRVEDRGAVPAVQRGKDRDADGHDDQDRVQPPQPSGDGRRSQRRHPCGRRNAAAHARVNSAWLQHSRVRVSSGIRSRYHTNVWWPTPRPADPRVSAHRKGPPARRRASGDCGVAFLSMSELTSRAEDLYLKVTQLREHL